MKKTVSICLTTKNRHNIKYSPADLTPEEAQYFLRVEHTLKIVENENKNNSDFITIKKKFKDAFRYTYDCIQSIIASIEANPKLNDYSFEIIITDWMSEDLDKQSLIDLQTPQVSIYFVDINEEGFSRGKGLNVAFDNSTGDIIFFIDADLLFVNTYMIYEWIKKVEDGYSVWPVFYKSHDPVFYNMYPEWASYGVCMVSRDQFLKYGRWPEYRKWGAEDLHLYERFLKDDCKIYRKNYLGFIHQWHCQYTRTREYDKNKI